VKIKLTYDQQDSVVVASLKWDILHVSDPKNDLNETKDNRGDMLCSLIKTLRYYSKPSEYETFVRKNGL
jgi:hypothetical protein